MGRAVVEPEAAFRTVYQRDRDRVVHSTAFRRLEYKTQVFITHVSDHFRNRLTHSLEVAQITRTIARSLGLDEDLAEAVALAHDLGHSPFGHAGEEALDAVLEDVGGFDHNVQSLRVLTRLERRYAAFNGLNLTAETLEGVLKHNGPLNGDLPAFVRRLVAETGIDPAVQATAEAQVAALCDDIAYVGHDLDDGMRAGFLDPDDFLDVPLVGPCLSDVRLAHGRLEATREIHETCRRVIDRMVGDCLTESRRRLQAAAPKSPDDLRAMPHAAIAFSPAMVQDVIAVKASLRDRLYRHYKVNRMALRASTVVRSLTQTLLDNPGCLPPAWLERSDGEVAGAVRDYVAGMTDRFALDEHAKLVGPDIGIR